MEKKNGGKEYRVTYYLQQRKKVKAYTRIRTRHLHNCTLLYLYVDIVIGGVVPCLVQSRGRCSSLSATPEMKAVRRRPRDRHECILLSSLLPMIRREVPTSHRFVEMERCDREVND